MDQTEIKAAIAQQEEHVKRVSTCKGRKFFSGKPSEDGISHHWVTCGPSGPHVSTEQYTACSVCGVTKTDADYRAKIAQED